MSVIVAIKEKGRIYIGCDSQVTSGGTRTTLKNPNNYKIWNVKGAEEVIMGSVGDVRDACIIRTCSDLIDDYDLYRDAIGFSYVVNHIVPTIIERMRDRHFIEDGQFRFMNSSFLLAYKDRLFVIYTDSTVIEVDDYVAIGSGKNEAIGSLLSTEGQDPSVRIIKAIKASAASDIYVDYPIVLGNTEKKGFEVITESNEKRFLAKEKENKE